MIRYWWVGLIILAAGFLVGRCSVPTVNTEAADAWQAETKAHDATRADRQRLRDSVRVLDSLRDVETAAALERNASLRRSVQRERARTEGLELALAGATSTADSLTIRTAQVFSLRVALDSSEARGDTLERQVVKLTADKARIWMVVDTLTEQVRADSVRLKIADDVIEGLKRAHSGCKYFGKIRCLRGSVSYDASDGGVLATAVYPISDLLGVGVSYRIIR